MMVLDRDLSELRSSSYSLSKPCADAELSLCGWWDAHNAPGVVLKRLAETFGQVRVGEAGSQAGDNTAFTF
jgi:hypothetical protein